jgi:transposase
VPSAETKLEQTQRKTAELAARLQVRERINAALITQLEREKHQLEQQTEQLARERHELLQQAETFALEKAQLLQQVSQYCEQNVLLKEELAWWKAQVFGRSSEKSTSDEVSPDQAMLFNEAEVLTAIAAATATEAAAPILIEAHERKKKPGKKAIPAEFPRVSVVVDIAEAEKVCPHDGAALEVMGAEKSERYDYVRPQLRVLVQERLKYACPCCRQGVKIAPLPPSLLPKSMASPSLLAHITTTKFVDGVPLTRQSKQFDRLGLSLGAGTMGIWMNTIGAEKLPPLINLMHEAILAEPVLHCDETSVQVLKSEKAVSSDHYMVVRAAGPPGKRIVLFNYEPNRNVAALKSLLTGPDGPYRGKLVVDGLGLYDHVADDPTFELILFGCLAHARRGFDKTAKVSESPSAHSLARVAIRDHIGKIYGVEREIETQRERRERAGKEWTLEETHAIRQQKSAPIMAGFKRWLEDLAPGVAPKSALGKAIGYCINQWNKLVRFVDHPDVPPDNNRVENDIRPFALGRRVWLFCDTQLGARASANLYSMVGTCRANGIEPHAYLTYLYTELPKVTTVEHLEALLPWNVKPLLKRELTSQP